jgi:hypothetical protein
LYEEYIHGKYFIKCLELVHTIDDKIAETSTNMSGIRKIHNQLVYNIEAFINWTKYIIGEITIRDLPMISDDMILGLRFLQHSVQTTFMKKELHSFHIKIMFHISQRYESVVESIESRIWTLGLKKSMISLKMIKRLKLVLA